jgi:hypothetical protein
MADANYMNQSQYAEYRRISQPRIAKLISQGKLDGAYIKKGGRYFIDPERADRILEQNRNPKFDARNVKKESRADGGSKPPAVTQGRTLNEAARLQMWYRAALMKLKYEKESGALVPKDKINKQLASLGNMIRTHLESLPSKLSPELAGLRNSKEIAACLQREVKSILAAMSHDIKKL